MSAIQDSEIFLRSLLRVVAAGYPGTMPDRLATWWTQEQIIMADEARHIAERNAEKRSDIEAAIAKLQRELDAL